MPRSRFSPRSINVQAPGAIRGLLLAVALQPESVALLLGCDVAEAAVFQDNARATLGAIKSRIADARAV